MAAIVSGSSLGLLNSSLYVLGAQGAIGQASQGRASEQVFVNADTGNLVIQNRDELLVGRGPDISILRTYNSQGLLDGDNNDNWRLGVYRKVTNLTSPVNTAGSTVTRVAEDGSESVYSYDTTLAKYVCHDGAGAYDTLSFAAATQTWTWSWSDGTNQLTERYDAANGGRITQVLDQDGNGLTFTYNVAGLITQVSDASGETTFLDYTGTNLTQLRTVNSSAQTLIRTRYAYDASNRLTTVTTDVSPEDASIADYVVTYAYDDANGLSKRVASLTQTDGNNLTFGYTLVGTDWKIRTITDATGKVTSLAYAQTGASTTPASANANAGVLSTTETTTVAPYYTVQNGNTWASITQTVYGTSDANAVAALQTALGNPAFTAGTRLAVPQTLGYNTTISSAANSAALSTIDTQSYSLNSGALTNPTSGVPQSNALQNWATVNNISGAVGTWTYYTIDVPAGQSELFVGTSGGTGDADFVVRYGANPDLSTYDASGFDNSTADEAALIQNPAAGTWYIGVNAWTDFSGVQLQTHYASGTAGTRVLQPGIAVSDLYGPHGSERAFSFNIPAGTSGFKLSLTGQAGQDVDLYLKFGTPPTNTVFDFASDGATAIESISVNAPQAGTWYALVQGYSNYTDTALVLHTNLGTNTAPTVQAGAPKSVTSGATATLAATGSDAQGAITYQWTQLSGPAVTLTNATSATASFTAPGVLGTTLLDFRVRVTDSQGATNTDIVHVIVSPASQSYTVQAGASWASIATALYGSASAASALQTALGNPALTAGNVLTGFPATLSVTATVPAYYLVPSGATWTSITQAVYGTSNTNAVAALQTALGNPALSTNLHLTVPATISYTAATSANANAAVLSTTITTTVAAYYAVQSGDTWSNIAQTVYGDAQAGGALQTAMGGGASPAVGAHLTVPQTLNYTKTIPGSLRTDVTDPLGLVTTLVTDAQGQLTQILAPAVGGARQSTGYAYDANGNVTSVTDARGLVTAYGYDANGNRTLERDAAGNTITRVFGSKNELLAETIYVVPDPDGAGAAQPSSPLTTRYLYDTNNHLRFSVSGEGRVTEYRYNAFGQRVAAIQYTGALYNLTGFTEANLTAWLPADKSASLRVDTAYDFRGQVSSTTSYAKVNAAGDGVLDGFQTVTLYVYNQAGNLLRTVDGKGGATTYVYDGLGRLTTTTDAAGHLPTTTFYDDANRKVVLTSSNQLKTTSIYDVKGELISVVQTVVLNSVTQVLGTTSYFYDADGRLRRTVDPTGAVNHILYDEAGRKIAAIDGTGTLTEYRYDADNNLTRTIQYATAAANLASLMDAQGNPTTVTLATIRPAASGQDRITANAYDSANRLVKSVDELGFVTQNFYDGAGRLTDTLRSANEIGLTLPGTTGSYAATPDSVANSVTGDIDLRARIAATDWTPSAAQDVIAKNVGLSSGFSYRVRLETSGALSIYWSEDGTTVKSATSTVPVSAADGTFKWVRVALDVDSGAGGRAIKFYVSDDYNAQAGAGTWTQLGSTVTQTGITSIFNGVANLELGASGGTDNPFSGKIAYAEVRNGIDGTVTAKFDPLDAALNSASPGVTNFVSGTGETWSLAGAAALNAASSNDRLTRNFYDADGKLRGTLDGEGYLVEYKYDAAGQLVETVGYFQPTSVAFGSGTLAQLVPAAADPNDIHRYTLYNAKGQVVGQIDGESYLTEYVYDAAGNKTQTIRYATRVTFTPGTSIASIRPLALNLPGVAGSYASTPDSVANSITGDIDIRVKLTRNNWVSSPSIYDWGILGKVASDGISRAYFFDIDNQGRLGLVTSPNGTSGSQLYTTSTVGTGFAAGSTHWIRVTLDVDNGAGSRVYKFYTSEDYDPAADSGTWTQLGATVTVAGTTSIFDGNYALGLSRHFNTAWEGKIYYAEVRNGINGAVVTKFNPAADATAATTTSFTSSTGEVWTLAGAAALSNPQDQVSSFTYTALNQLASATDFEGTRTDYAYDEMGNLTQTVKAVGTSDARTSSARYDWQGRLTAQMDGKGSTFLTGGQTQAQIDAVFAANGTRYAYDADGRRIRATDANGNRTLFYYDADGHLTHTINASGEVTENQYNVLGQLKQTVVYGGASVTSGRIDGAILATLTGGLVNTTLTNAVAALANPAFDSVSTYSYTLRGQVASALDPMQLATTNTYNAFGDRTASSEQLGSGQTLDHSYEYDRRALLTRTVWDPAVVASSQLTVYDAFGRATQSTDANGNVRTQKFDRLGRVIATTVDPGTGQHLAIGTGITYDAFDRVLTQRDALNNVTAFSYDKTNRSVTMTTPEGVSVVTVHNRQGETQSITDGRGNSTQYTYDLDGKLKQVTRTNAQAQAISTTVNTYDKADRLTDTQDANGNTVHYTYDAANRLLTRVVDPGNLALKTTYEYDAKGLTRRVTDARNIVTETIFDKGGRKTTVTVDPGATGHLNLTTTYLYDGKNALTVTEGVGSGRTRVTKYSYDHLGRRIQEQIDPADLNITTTYVYDKNNNVVSKTEAVGKDEARTTRYVYDAADRLVWTIDALGDVSKNEYDAEGHITRTIAYAKPLTNFATLPPTPAESDVNLRLIGSPSDQLTTHVFDKDGREVYTIDAVGAVTKKVYDAAGNVIETTAYVGTVPIPTAPKPADVAGLVSETNLDNRTTRTVYDAANRATFAIDAMGYVTQRFYDGNGKVTKEIAYAGPLQGTFTAGTAPQILGTPPPTGSWVIVDALHDRTTRQIYDAAGRMVYGVDAEGYVTERRLDAMGNETSRVRYADKVVVADGATVAGMAAFFRGTVWVDDAAPAGAILAGDEPWTWVTSNPSPQSGTAASQSVAIAGEHQHYFSGATATLAVNTGDILYAYVYLDPANPPSEVMLQWNDGTWEHRAYWGANNIPWGADGTASRRYMGPLPATGGWVRLEVPASLVGLEGRTVNGMAFTLFDGKATWDNAGKVCGVLEQARYDNAGRVYEVVDGEGSVTRNLYDALGNKTDVIRALGTSAESTTRYDYDAAGRLKQETAAYGTTIAATTRYLLDAFGNRTGIIDPRGVEITEQNTAWAQAERQQLFNTPSLSLLLPGELTDLPKSYTTTQAFDKAGRKISSTIPRGFRVPGSTTTTVYDARGNAIKITDPRGNSGYFYFDANDKVRFHIDPMGYATEYRYDAFGGVTDELHYADPVLGGYDENTTLADLAQRATTWASADNRQTSKAYDRMGRVSTVSYPGTAYTETYLYGAFGDKTQYKDKSDAVYNYEYDRAGNLKTETAPAADIVTASGTRNARLATQYDYDAFGNRIKMTEAAGIPGVVGRFTAYKYDNAGRQIRIEAPAFLVYDRTSNASTLLAPTTERTYDAAGNLVMELAPDGGRVINYYDALNRKVRSVNADNALSEYEYDSAGNLVRERTYDTRLAGVPDWRTWPTALNPGAYREIRYRYNAANLRIGTDTPTERLYSALRLESIGSGYYDGSDSTSTEYNANGDAVRTIDGNGNVTFQFYDAAGNRTLQVHAYRSYEFVAGHARLTDPVGYVIRWEYNAEGQVTKEVRYASALSAAFMATLSAAADPRSVINAIAPTGQAENPNDRVTVYIYDRLGRVTTERKAAVTYSVLDAAHIPVDRTGDLDTRYEYDGNGKLTAVILPNSQGRTDYLYDPLGRRTKELDPQFQAFSGYNQLLVPTREETHWAYDAFGNAVVETKLAPLAPSENRETSRTYDNAGRLRTETGPGGLTTTYDYDIAGNVVRKTSQVQDIDLVNHTYRTYYAYDRLNRERSRQDTEDEGTALSVIRETHDTRYNAHGDIEAKGANGQYQEQYRYDKLGRLFWTNKENGTPRLYVYDANGNAVLELQAADTDLATVAGPNGPVPVTSPSQIPPDGMQLTVTYYDSRNQATDVALPPMDFNTLVTAPVIQETGTPVPPAETALGNLAQPIGTSQMNWTGGQTTPTGGVPPRTIGSPLTTPANGYGPLPTYSPVQVQVTLADVGLAVPITLDLPPVASPPETTFPDSATKVLTERLTKRSQTIQGAVQGLNVVRTTTTTTDTFLRRTTYTRQTAQTNATSASADSLTTDWTLSQVEDFNLQRNVDVKQETITRRRDFSVAGGYVGTNSAVPPQGALAYTPAGSVVVTVNPEQGPPWTDDTGTVHTETGFYEVYVTVPALNYFGNGVTSVSNTWMNGAQTDTLTITGAGRVGRFWQGYDGHGVTVTKGGVLVGIVGMDRNAEFASFALQPVIAIKGLPSTARLVQFTSKEGTKIIPLSSQTLFPGMDGFKEFIYKTQLQPGDTYTYKVFDGEETATPLGNLLKSVSGRIGGNGIEAREDDEYKLAVTESLIETVMPGTDSNNNYNYSAQTVESPKQNAYLRSLAMQISQGGPNSNAIHRAQAYNAFGEVIAEIDGRENRTDFVYNDLGKLITKKDPMTDVHMETGDPVPGLRPTTHYYYDELGQLVGTQDAVSDLKAAGKYYSTRVLVAGRVEREFDPDGNVKVYRYDSLGNQRWVTDEMGLDTVSEYDRNGRLTKIIRYDQNDLQFAYDKFAYDLAGNRFSHENALGATETYKYDGQGRILRHTSFAGAQTSYQYGYFPTIGGIGGYQKRTKTDGIDASGNPVQDEMVDQTDYFGKIRYHRDMDGHEFTYQYNYAGWLKQQDGTTSAPPDAATSAPARPAQHITYDYYKNGYLKSVSDTGINSYSLFQYDRNGNRTHEAYSQAPIEFAATSNPSQTSEVVYDALNRVKSVTDQRYAIQYTYDANGNRRSVLTTYFDPLSNNPAAPQNFYYKYDRMNRFTTTMGQRDGAGNIVRGSTGYDIAYNALGERMSVSSDHLDHGVAIPLVETYSYDPIGTVFQATINNLKTRTVRTTTRTNDALGRVLDYTVTDADPTTTHVARHVTYQYTADNLTDREVAFDAFTGETRTTAYNYFNNTGILKSIVNTSSVPNSATVTLSYFYEKWDSYKERLVKIEGAAPTVDRDWRNGISTYAYDANGHIKRVFDSQAVRTFDYVNNHLGEVLLRSEIGGGSSPVIRRFFTLNGVVIGDVGTDRIASNVDYAQVLADYDRRTIQDYVARHGDATLGTFDENGNSNNDSQSMTEIFRRTRPFDERVSPVTSADFDQNYRPITDSYPAHAAGSLVARQGDSLRSIAQSLWGDSSLWYLLAEANGLKDGDQVPPGMRLTVPNVVTNFHNNAQTFRPYDPGFALGDTTPTLPDPPPPPQQSGGCGGFGAALVMVVVIVVAVYTQQYYLLNEVAAIGGAAAAAADVAATAAVVGAAAGNLAGQAVGNLIGAQHGFSMESFMSSVFTAGVGAAIGPIGSGVWGQMATAAVNSAVGQGVNVLTGQQKKFDWRGVAAAAVAAPVVDSVGKGVSNLTDGSVFATRLVTGSISEGINYAAHRGRQSFNYARVAADAFGSMVGNSLVEDLARAGEQKRVALEKEYAATADREDAGLVVAMRTNALAGMIGQAQGRGYASPYEPLAANGPAVSLVPSGERDLSTREGIDAFLRETRSINVGGGEISPQDVSTAKALLFHYYGYAMGDLRGSQADLAGSLDETRTPAFARALEAFAGNSGERNQERYDFYTNIKVAYDANGDATNGRYIDVTRNGETRTVTWTENSSQWARDVGVSADEALRKTDFDVYQTAISASFATKNMTGFDISGGWRPSANDYRFILNTTPPYSSNRSQHIASRALDIGALHSREVGTEYVYSLNNENMSGQNYVRNAQGNYEPATNEPVFVTAFTDNLRNQAGVTQVFQPWWMWSTNPGGSGAPNLPVQLNDRDNSYLHRNHLHFGIQ